MISLDPELSLFQIKVLMHYISYTCLTGPISFGKLSLFVEFHACAVVNGAVAPVFMFEEEYTLDFSTHGIGIECVLDLTFW